MIYLDNAATSFPKPEPVYQALDHFARTSLANPGRAGHRMAVAAEQALDAARHALNQFFRGESPDRWIFTHNCTDGLNLAMKGVLCPGDHVVTTDLEHNSISRPLEALRASGVISLSRVKSVEGYLDPDEIKRFERETRLVALTHASNVLGRPASRGHRRDRRRTRRSPSGRRGPNRRCRADRSSRTPIDMLAFPVTNHFTVRPAPGPSTSAPEPTARSEPGAREVPEATLPARLSPSSSLSRSKAVLPTCSESPDSPPECLGCRTGAGKPAAARSRIARARGGLGKRPGGLPRCRPIRPRFTRGSALAHRPRLAGAPGSRRDPRYQLQHRRPPRIALRSLHPSRDRDLSSRHDPAEPGRFNTLDDVQAFIDALSQITAEVGV